MGAEEMDRPPRVRDAQQLLLAIEEIVKGREVEHQRSVQEPVLAADLEGIYVLLPYWAGHSSIGGKRSGGRVGVKRAVSYALCTARVACVTTIVGGRLPGPAHPPRHVLSYRHGIGNERHDVVRPNP